MGELSGLAQERTLTMNSAEIMAVDAHDGLINSLVSHQDLLISTDGSGFAKVWSIAATDSTIHLERSEQLYDLAVTDRCVLGDFLITAGKHKGESENACGLDMRLKMWSTHGEDFTVKDIGMPAAGLWSLARLPLSESVAIAVKRRGKVVVEIWKKTREIEIP